MEIPTMPVTHALIRPGGEREARELEPLEPRYVTELESILAAYEEGDPDDLWFLVHPELLSPLLAVLALQTAISTGPTLWVRFRTGPEQLAALSVGFSPVLANPEAALGSAPLAVILRAEHPEDHVVAAHHVAKEDLLVLWRGDFSSLLVPLASLRERAAGRLNPRRLALADHGQTLAFGETEVSVDAILHARDPLYRRRSNARRRALDTSFGGCLRRLRLLRGLGRDDFPGLSAKTIARIERGEVERPHPKTLRSLAAALGVEVDEIERY